MTADPPAGLRERKKLQTRAAILAAASELFEARGYEHVTVAEIADAANISVKTLFTYFRSKEDLAFADEHRLRDQLVAAIRTRPAGSSPVQAVAALLDRLVDEGGETGLAEYHRGYGGSQALASRLRRMWESYEEALSDALTAGTGGTAGTAGTAEASGPFAAPSARLTAAMLVAMVRSFTWPEVLAEAQAQPSAQAARERLRAWVAAATPLVSCLDQHCPTSTDHPSTDYH